MCRLNAVRERWFLWCEIRRRHTCGRGLLLGSVIRCKATHSSQQHRRSLRLCPTRPGTPPSFRVQTRPLRRRQARFSQRSTLRLPQGTQARPTRVSTTPPRNWHSSRQLTRTRHCHRRSRSHQGARPSRVVQVQAQVQVDIITRRRLLRYLRRLSLILELSFQTLRRLRRRHLRLLLLRRHPQHRLLHLSSSRYLLRHRFRQTVARRNTSYRPGTLRRLSPAGSVFRSLNSSEPTRTNLMSTSAVEFTPGVRSRVANVCACQLIVDEDGSGSRPPSPLDSYRWPQRRLLRSTPIQSIARACDALERM